MLYCYIRIVFYYAVLRQTASQAKEPGSREVSRPGRATQDTGVNAIMERRRSHILAFY